MKVVVTTKDFCEEAKRYLESEGFEVALRNPKLPRNSSVLTFSPSSFAGICC